MKNKYEVCITEKLQMTVPVEASSKEEAEEIVARAWRNGDYILDGDHFVGAEFSGKRADRRRPRADER